MSGTLILTNDFPPGIGGIEAFVAQLAAGLRGPVVVLTRQMRGSAEFDAARPYSVIRVNSPVLLPTPGLAKTAAMVLHDHGLSTVVFGAAAPLGLLAPRLRRAGARRLVGISHGHEVWWARLPVSAALLRRIGNELDVLTYVSEFTRTAIGSAMTSKTSGVLTTSKKKGATSMRRLSPPVRMDGFAAAHRSGRLSSRPVLLSAGRFVKQKGFDVLLQAWRIVVQRWPHEQPPLLRIAGGQHPGAPTQGRLGMRLAQLAEGLPVEFLGPLNHAQMPAFFASGDGFASPVRSRLGGLNSEGFGLVFAEAAAAGLPVLVGDSGGAGETVVDGLTGYLLDPHDAEAWATRTLELLLDPPRARAWGEAGKVHIGERFSERACVAVLQEILDGAG